MGRVTGGGTFGKPVPFNTTPMDIDALEVVSEDEGALVHLRDREGKPEYENGAPVTMRVAGQYSERYRKASRDQRERQLKKRSFNVDADYLDEAPKEIEAACIIEWPFTSNGKPLPITATNWNAIISKRPWYRPQVQDAIERYASFFEEKPAA